MKIIDVGPQAIGFIAIGQHATGFFALGQVATGVIAIGQLARGVFAVGQLAVGVIGWGQGGIGIMHAIGMLGVGGRGLGIVLPLVPSLGRARVPPQVTPYPMIQAGAPGWIAAQLSLDAYGLGLYDQGTRLPIKLDHRVFAKAQHLCQSQPCSIWASVVRVGPQLVCDRIVYEPERPFAKQQWWVLSSFRMIGLLILGVAYWMMVGNDLLDFASKAISTDGAPASTAPAKSPPPPTTHKPDRK